MTRGIHRDKFFWAAFMAAPLFCTALLFYQSSLFVDWSWPFNYPQKFLLLVLIYPFLEEIIFRGLLQTVLHERGMAKRLRPGLSMANIVTSILFMLSHFVYHEWQWASAILGPSLIFGHFRDKYQSIAPGIALHIFYNLVYFWLFGVS